MKISKYKTLKALCVASLFISCNSWSEPGASPTSPKIVPRSGNETDVPPDIDLYATPVNPNRETAPSPVQRPADQAGLEDAAKDASQNGGNKTDKKLAENGADLIKNKSTLRKAFHDADQAQAKSILSPSSSNPSEAAKIRNDQEKIRKAKQADKDGKSFSERDAEEAQNPEIRKNLLIISRNLKEREKLEREKARLTDQLTQFGKLVTAAAAAAGNMGEIKPPVANGNSVSISNQKSKDAGVSIPNESKENSLSATAEFNEEKIEGLSSSEKVALLKELSGGYYKGKKIKDASLKNKLIAQLKSAEAAEKRAAGDSTSGVNQAAKRENAAAKVISDVLTPPADAGGDYNAAGGSRGSGSFSLSTSETDAEVKRLTDEADRQLTAADDTKAGILEVESPSLFERVSTRIKGCLRQRCVNSRSLAQN